MDDFTKLNAGDEVRLNGTIFTARDKAHLFLMRHNFERLRRGIIYHCGPIIRNNGVIAAGPTTSARLNPYTPDIIDKYKIRAIIGKGGMDEDVLHALKGRAVYFSAVGGAALVYAKCMRVVSIHKEEFGMAEAIWEFFVEDFPVIVTMDAKGNNIYNIVRSESRKRLDYLLEEDINEEK